MKTETDFIRGVRGKLFRRQAEMRLPIYLDPEIESYLAERAAKKGVRLAELTNGLLKQAILMMESVQ